MRTRHCASVKVVFVKPSGDGAAGPPASVSLIAQHGVPVEVSADDTWLYLTTADGNECIFAHQQIANLQLEPMERRGFRLNLGHVVIFVVCAAIVLYNLLHHFK